MVKKLTKHGNSLALVIDRPILDLLNIDPETPLDVSTDGKRLIMTPAKPSERRAKFEKASVTAARLSVSRSKAQETRNWNRSSSHSMRRWRSMNSQSSCMAARTAFVNKRAGASAAITFLLMNDWEPTFTEEQLVDLVLGVAQGVVGRDRIAKFFEECTGPAE